MMYDVCRRVSYIVVFDTCCESQNSGTKQIEEINNSKKLNHSNTVW